MRTGCGRRRGIVAVWLIAMGIAMPMAVRAQAPGPELFAREPRTPLELWEAIDYLVRTGQAAKAVPYLDRFVKAQPDDATMIAVRDRYGVGSFLRLDSEPATRPFARPLADRLAAAARQHTTRPERMRQLIDELFQSPEEQAYAIRRLWEAGPYAVPPLFEALNRPDVTPEEHDRLVRSLGRLQPSAIPPLAAALEGSDPARAADAAVALGAIGDRSAVPFLTFPAASPTSAPALRSSARAAIARLTGTSFASQPIPPLRLLVNTAWAYHRARPEGPEEPAVLWSWDAAARKPSPTEATPAEVRTTLGLNFARQALRLDPNDRSAQVAQLSLALDRAAQRVGPEAVASKEPATFAAATAAGPALLSQVLETSIADRKPELEAVAILALAKVTDRAALTATGRPHPLIRALSAPGRRAQFAAARAIVELAPDRPFAGSSLVAKALGRFLVDGPQPRAVVIDANASRAGQLGSALSGLGYTVETESTGDTGFLAAAAAADVELVLIAYDLHRGWTLIDTLANLQADARTSALPLFVYGPYDLRYTRPSLPLDFPGMRFLVPSAEPLVIERQLGGRPSRLSEAERVAYARESAELLARIAAIGGPMAKGLGAVGTELAAALRSPATSKAAVAALATVPDPDAQRSVFDTAMDPSQPPEVRVDAARRLAAAVARFGPLFTRDQEARLANEIDGEPDPAVHDALAGLIVALRSRGRGTRPAAPVAPVAPTRSSPTGAPR